MKFLFVGKTAQGASENKTDEFFNFLKFSLGGEETFYVEMTFHVHVFIHCVYYCYYVNPLAIEN